MFHASDVLRAPLTGENRLGLQHNKYDSRDGLLSVHERVGVGDKRVR